jgi:hypothetical protein
MDAKTTGLEAIVRGFDGGDQLAVITLRELMRDFVLEVEALAKVQRTLGHRRVTA